MEEVSNRFRLEEPPFRGEEHDGFPPFLWFGMSIRFLAVGLAAFAVAIVMAALPLIAQGA
jgi:hypothetical protein